MQNHAPVVKKKDRGRSKSHGRNKSKSKYHDLSDEEEGENANDSSFDELHKGKQAEKPEAKSGGGFFGGLFSMFGVGAGGGGHAGGAGR